jgi:hypothetical protein
MKDGEESILTDIDTRITVPVVKHADVSPLFIIAQAVSRGMSMADMKDLVAMARQERLDKAAQAFAEALTAFQSECPQIEKWKEGGRTKDPNAKAAYKYAPFEEIDHVARPFMVKHRIVTTFNSKATEKGITVTCRVRVGTHFEETEAFVPSITGNSLVNAAQIQAMMLSYGKRYALCAALNIVCKDEDTDGLAGDSINKAQVDEIMGLVKQCSDAGKPVAFPKFLEWMGVEKLEDLPQRELAKALSELRNKLRAAKGGDK